MPASSLKPVAVLLVAVATLAVAPPAAADLADEQALANRHAPVVRLVEQAEECGFGEPYEPLDVDALFDEPTVALRGPWNRFDLVEIGPSADDLVDLYEYHLDFPGDALNPGCSYELWARRVTAERSPAVYAHVATEAGRPGRLALQYWFFYAYNDWNNLHEGDWENVQLLFDAGRAREALGETPVAVGYSQHEGSERGEWDDDKLELVDGTRPVVYPAAGSHANFFDDGLYLGSSAQQGVGCDDTRGPHLELKPRVVTIPTDVADARGAYPWIAFEGRWGELQDAFFNGPTGPNLKESWTEPISLSEEWRDRSYAVPAGGILGTNATDFFCDVVAAGSRGLTQFLRSPGAVLLTLTAVLLLAAFLASRTEWRPTAPLRVARRRTWGQILAASARLYFRRAPLFIGIGLVLIPLGLLAALAQALLLGGLGLAGIEETGVVAGAVAIVVVALGTTLTLLGLLLVQAAISRAVVSIDEGRRIGPLDAYRESVGGLRSLLGGAGVLVAFWLALSVTVLLLPVAIWLAIRWALLAQVVELEGRPAIEGLRRSGELVRERWLRVASLVGVGALLALLAGPLLGALLILLTDMPLALLNVVAGVVYTFALPFVAVTTCYVYFDARSRFELEPPEDVVERPAEIRLT
jgi:hypothetical protein